MEKGPYLLWDEGQDSLLYYKQVDKVAQMVKKELLQYMKSEIKHFQNFVIKYQLEEMRTEIEYGLELLMIGVFWGAYERPASKMNPLMGKVLIRVSKVRKKAKYIKPMLSKLKGKWTDKYLGLDALHQRGECNLKRLVFWMKATGEYDEEVLRIEQWLAFLGEQTIERQHQFKKKVFVVANDFEYVVEEKLSAYISGVKDFRESKAKEYETREDRIFCMQPPAIYYLNMVGAEILNEVYREAFLQASKYVIFLPGCMVYRGKEGCKATYYDGAYKCQGCTPECQVNQISQMSLKYQAQTTILYHESEFNNKKVKNEEINQIGVIGVACLLSLLSGGFKAKRLGYIPQCVLLDYCGCKQHWDKKGRTTQLNMKKLQEILGV